MRTNETRLSVLALALALTGCWEPKSHDALQSDDGVAAGGPWNVCEDAAVHGVSDDSCDFPEGVGGCFIPEWLLVAPPERVSPDGTEYLDTTFHAAAGCLSSREMLIRSEWWQSSLAGGPPTDPCSPSPARRTSDGCVELEQCGIVDAYCVPDTLLPPAADGPLVVLESPEDCEALRVDAEARPGLPCSGERICDVGFATTPPTVGSSEPALVWCHAERLRFALTYGFHGHGSEDVTSVYPRM